MLLELHHFPASNLVLHRDKHAAVGIFLALYLLKLKLCFLLLQAKCERIQRF